MKIIKEYSEVEVGDIAMENPDAGGEWNNEIGHVVWKGNAKQLRESSEYSSLIQHWEDNDADIEDYDLAVVKCNEWYCDILYNYDNDPSGFVVFK